MKGAQFLTVFHTSMRNIVAYTGTSFAALGHSRYYSGKIPIYNIGILMVSLCLISVAIIINYLFIQDTLYLYYGNTNANSKDNDELKIDYKKWLIIPRITLVMVIVVYLFTLYTIIREIRDKVLK